MHAYTDAAGLGDRDGSAGDDRVAAAADEH